MRYLPVGTAESATNGPKAFCPLLPSCFRGKRDAAMNPLSTWKVVQPNSAFGGQGEPRSRARHSEIFANLLYELTSNFREFSERALINIANHLDFDSATRRFHTVQSPHSTPMRASTAEACSSARRRFLSQIVGCGFEGLSLGKEPQRQLKNCFKKIPALPCLAAPCLASVFGLRRREPHSPR
jgi:hypothetical protein